MSRPPGSRNADFAVSAEALLRALRPGLLAPGGTAASFRELARGAGVSVATLRHYFPDRAAVVAASLALLHREGLPHLAEAATSDRGEVQASLRWFLDAVVLAWSRFGVGPAHVMGLAAGLQSETLGPAYVTELLEPTLQAGEARIARHVAQGELGPCDLRHAALELLSPVVLGLLHQQALFGARCRPLAMDAFLADHLARFLRAYAPAEPRTDAGRAPGRASGGRARGGVPVAGPEAGARAARASGGKHSSSKRSR